MFDQVGGLSLLALRSQQTRLSNYYAVATCAWLVYDHLLTLPLEIRCMWHAPFRGTSLLFYINRYGALALRLLVVAQGTADISPLSSEEAADSFCGELLRATEVLSLLLQIDLIVILSLRVYAIWGSRKAVASLVFLTGMLPAVVVMYTYSTDVATAWEPDVPITGCTIFTGWSPEDTDAFGYAVVAATVAFDVLVLALTVSRTVSTARVFARLGIKTSLSELLLRDGILYFVSLLILNVVNILQIRFAHQRTSRVLGDGLSALFVSRFMLNLRAALVEPDATLGSADGARGAKMSGIRFVAGAAEEFGGSFGSASGGGYDDETDGTDGDSGTGHEMDVVAGVEEDGQLDSVVHLAQGSEA